MRRTSLLPPPHYSAYYALVAISDTLEGHGAVLHQCVKNMSPLQVSPMRLDRAVLPRVTA
jgi:hypothetical protein